MWCRNAKFAREPNTPYLRNIPQIIGALILWFREYTLDYKGALILWFTEYSVVKGYWALWVSSLKPTNLAPKPPYNQSSAESP